MTPESLARTIAKARHGTDAYWAGYVGAAEAVLEEVVEACARHIEDDDWTQAARLRALLTQPDGPPD